MCRDCDNAAYLRHPDVVRIAAAGSWTIERQTGGMLIVLRRVQIEHDAGIVDLDEPERAGMHPEDIAERPAR